MSTRIYPWFKKALPALKLAVTLTLLAVTLRMVHFGTLSEIIRQADPGWLAAAALILVLGGFAGAASWFCVLRLRLPDVRFRDAAACHWVGMFFNSFLPSNVGGDVVKGVLIHQSGARPPSPATPPSGPGFIVASLFIDRAVNLAMLLGIGGFAWLFQRCGPPAAFAALAAFLLALTGCLTAAARLFFPAFASRLSSLAALLLTAFASQFLKTWSNLFVVLALGLKIPFACVWSVIPLFGLVSALPISIGGLGVRELVAQRIAGPLQVDGAHLVALSLAGHLLTVLVNLLGALPFAFRRPAAATPQDGV